MAITNLRQWSSSKWLTLKIRIGLKLLINPRPNPFLDPVMGLNHISKRGPYSAQYNGPLPYCDQNGVVGSYDQNPTDVKNLSARYAVSEMKRWVHFPDQWLNKIQNSLGKLCLIPSATQKSTRQKLVVKQRNFWPSDMQVQPIKTPLDPSTHLTDSFDYANETKTAEVKFCA